MTWQSSKSYSWEGSFVRTSAIRSTPPHEIKAQPLCFDQQRGQGARFEVIQLDNGMLGLQGIISFRLSVERDSTGTATKLIGHYVEGGKDESPRTTQATSD